MNQNKEHDVLNFLTPIFRNVFDEPNLVLNRELTAKDVESWDSLNHIMLIVQIEEMTNLQFTTDQLVRLNNVGDFLDLIIKLGFNGNAQHH